MDFSFLSNPTALQLPDPTAMAIRGQTLANLSQQNQEGQMKLDALRQAQEVKQAAARVFGDAQSMGWDAAIKKAASEGNTLGAAAALQLRRQDEGDAAKIDNDRAQANERNSAAVKNTMAAKVDGFKQFASVVTGVASGQVPVSDGAMSAAYESARAILPDNVVRTMPADPAQFKQWATQFADPKTLTEIWEKQQTVPATVAKDYSTANKNNVEAQYIPQDSNSRRITANAAASNASTNAGELGLKRDQYNNPLLQHVIDPNNGALAFNPRSGAFNPATDANGNPLPNQGKPLTEVQGNATAFGMRMKAADEIFSGLESSGFDPGTLPNTYLPANKIGNYLADPKAQQAYQSKLNFMTASLRKESGAAISASEFESEDKKYFPQPGDSAQVRAQKAQMRELAMQAMAIQAGPGSKNIEGVKGSAGVAPPRLGEVRKGYLYKGGDPASQSSWEKVN